MDKEEWFAGRGHRAVAEGPDGTIWTGTPRGVWLMRDRQLFRLLSEDMEVTGHNLLPLPSGNLLARSRSSVLRFNSRGVSDIWADELKVKKGPSSALFAESSGRLWMGVGREVVCLDQNHWKAFELPGRGDETSVRTIHQDQRGDIWLGTFGGGLVRLRDNEMTVFKTNRGDQNNRAWWIHEDSDGVFWVASEDGLNRFVPPQPERPSSRINLFDDSSLSRKVTIGSQPFFTFTTQHGLGENTVNNIQEDRFGYLWLSGLKGIYRISRQQLNAVVDGGRDKVDLLALGQDDGMLSSECNGGDNQPSGCVARDGHIWFPTSKGLVEIDPEAIRVNELEPPVVIESILANNQPVFGDGATNRNVVIPNFQKAVALGASQRGIVEIRYAANSFAAPKRVRFQYMLEGWDRGWQSDDDNRRVAFYPNLRHGRYTFRVTACNNHGVWNKSGVSCLITVAPFFWETWWLYGLVAAVVLGLAAAVQAYRMRWQRRVLSLEHQHALADERARIARDIHDDLGSRFSQLAILEELADRHLERPDEARSHLAKLRSATSAAFQALDEIVWAANPRQDSLEGLVSYLREYVPEFLNPAGIQCRLQFPDALPLCPLTAQTRHQLFLVVKEALQNVVKHARATEVAIELRADGNDLTLTVKDNGCGYETNNSGSEGRSRRAQFTDATLASSAPGNGLANMRHRIAKIDGQIYFRSARGQGTEIEIHLPLSRGAKPE
ncbi:MAG: ATP-binding protein [Verrucomicrobiota bacterium]